MDLTNGDAEKLWSELQDALREELSDATWRTWFSGVRAEAIHGDTLELLAPSSITEERIRSSYGGLISDTLLNIGGPCQRFELRVADHDLQVEERQEVEPVFTSTAPGTRPAEWERHGPNTLNPRYTFEQFVAGASNRAVREMSLGVAEAPARYVNPFFIYGPSGLGKTHLMQAIAHHVLKMFPQKRVLYVSTEALLHDYVEAARRNEWADFKKRYRELDVLLVDDIQFLEKKEGLQEEFFHTFNALHQSRAQIVLASDRPPKAIATLEDRLRSRFEMGLTTDIQPPDFETRLAILQNKVEADRITGIPLEVLTYIAAHIHDNVRQLEGALTRIAAYSSLYKVPLTEEVTRGWLEDLLPEQADRVITPQIVLEETSKKFGYSIDDLRGRSRRSPVVFARQMAMYVLRELTDFSYPRIAEEFGGRDHTTVMHAVDKIKTLMAEKRGTLEQVNDLISRIKLGSA